MLRTTPADPGRGRRVPAAVAVLLLPALAGCGVGFGDEPLQDQPPVVAPSGLPVPLDSGPRVGASGSANALTGEPVPDGRVLAVVVDDAPEAQPPAGLDRADLVYLAEAEDGEPVLLALFQTEVPGRVGPVRPARSVDVALLADHGPVALASAGAEAGVADELSASGLQPVSSDAGGEGFTRDPAREAPYDVVGDGEALLDRAAGSGVAQDVGLRFGPLAADADPTGAVTYDWSASTLELVWSDADGAWVRQRDGEPALTEEGDPVLADNVLLLGAPDPGTDDVGGATGPAAGAVGTGPVTLLRDGAAVTGTWERGTEAGPTTLSDAAGGDLLLDVGTTWVVRMAPGGSPTLTAG